MPFAGKSWAKRSATVLEPFVNRPAIYYRPCEWGLYVSFGPYFFDFVFSADVAEQANKYEIEAREQAAKVRADLEKNGNPCK